MRQRRRAERNADADLARAVSGAGEQQVGDVANRDEQHEGDRAQQREEHQANLAAVLPLAERHQIRGPEILVGVGKLIGQCGRDRRQFRLRLFPRDAGFQQGKRRELPRVAVHRLHARRHVDQGNPQLVVRRKCEVGWHDADDGRGEGVRRDRLADHTRITAVAALPEAVADDDDRRRPGLVVLRKEVAAEDRLLANRLEDVPARCRHPGTDPAHGRDRSR